MVVICCKVNDSCLGWCIHSEEHEPEDHSTYGLCTRWDICVLKDDTEIKARCTKVKEKSGEKNTEK